MLKRMSIILCGVILGCGISVFASTEEKGSVGAVSDNDLEERASVSLDRVDDVPGIDMDRYDKKEIGSAGETEEAELGSVSGDGVSGREEDALDEIVSANEVLEGLDETVSTDEIPEENETEKEMEEGTVSGENVDQQSEDGDKAETVVKVSFPEKIHISLDPKNFLGKGDIYSDEYKIVNYGNRDVVINIKMTDVFYKNKEDVQERPNVEDLDVEIVWDNEKNVKRSTDAAGGDNVYIIYLKASQYDENNEFVKLGDGSEMVFRFAGEINGDPDAQWNADDLGLRFSYKIERATGEEGQEKVDDLVNNETVSENENEQYKLE